MRMFNRRWYLFNHHRKGKCDFKNSTHSLMNGKGIYAIDGVRITLETLENDDLDSNMDYRAGSYPLKYRYLPNLDFNDIDPEEQSRSIALFVKNRLQPKLFTNHKLSRARY